MASGEWEMEMHQWRAVADTKQITERACVLIQRGAERVGAKKCMR